jgi:pimeloyl-ACP methyl ester carboxylesterase
MEATTHYVISADGTRIAYDVQGGGPTLILLHPYPRSRRIWHDVGYPQRLQGQFQVITIDLRGLGESAKPSTPSGYAIGEYLADVHAVADACGAARFFVWGHSFGASIAAQMSAASPRVRTAVLAGTSYGDGFQSWVRTVPLADIADLANGKPDSPETFPPNTEAFGSLHEELAFWRVVSSWPVIEAQQVRCPVLLYAGSRDQASLLDWIREQRTEMKQFGISVQVFEGLTHLQELTEIERVLPPVLAFLSQQRERE